MEIDIIATGSRGNCFLIDGHLLVDFGIPYSKVKDVLPKYVLLTHIHGDHFHVGGIQDAYVAHRDTIFVCGHFLKKELLNIGIPNANILVMGAGEVEELGGYKVSPFRLYHDAPNFGWRIVSSKGHKHFHATDTAHLNGITARNYDTATIECNYDKNRAPVIVEEAKEYGVFSHISGAMNSHLSVQDAVKFCDDNNIGKLIPVHISGSTEAEVMEYLKLKEMETK